MKVIYLNLDSKEEAGFKEIEVENLNWAEGANISYTQILKSAAGYYIGALCKADYGTVEFWEPNFRDSACYWKTREEAEAAFISGNYPVKF